MKKRAVSEIVATVLIIAITIVAVGVIAAWVVPMVKNNLEGGTACATAERELSIALDSGLNCVDEEGNVSLSVKRGADSSVSITGAQVLVYVNGSSISANDTNTIPGLNEQKAWSVNSSSYVGASKISIAPIITVGKITKTCKVSSEVALVACN